MLGTPLVTEKKIRFDFFRDFFSKYDTQYERKFEIFFQNFITLMNMNQVLNINKV